jgi:hypothetical protein
VLELRSLAHDALEILDVRWADRACGYTNSRGLVFMLDRFGCYSCFPAVTFDLVSVSTVTTGIIFRCLVWNYNGWVGVSLNGN